MLTYLRIRDLAVIEDVALELAPGLTVLTGETGAGKSIIIDGLALALGARASLDMIRGGAERAVVEAAFTYGRDPEVGRMLEGAGLGSADGNLVVRRVLTPSASRAYVNDQLVTQQQLLLLGERLTDLHGQHEHQSLLSVSAHRDLLDRFASAVDAVARVADGYDAAVAAGERLAALQTDDRDRAQRADLLRFQVQEIEAAGLRPGEDRRLEAERGRLAHAEEIAEAAAESVALLYEDDASAAALLHRAERLAGRLLELDPQAPVELEALRDARIVAQEAARSLQGYQQDLEPDPRRLADVEERLAAIERLERKYGDGIEAVLEHARVAAAELDALDHRDDEVDRLERELERCGAEYAAATAALTELRRRAAVELAAQVVAELRDLAMPEAAFEVLVERSSREAPRGLPDGAGRRGVDRVEFRLSANAGDAPGSLGRIASGGELSRVMMALKLSATEGDPIETLVFDEVDAGIGGGRVAERLAQRLAALSRTHQVLVVTHLPQVAAYSDAWIGIRKETEEGRAGVRAESLGRDGQIEELARMLGGVEITDVTRRHAREMLSARE